MKKTLLLAIGITLFIFSSCKKDNETVVDGIKHSDLISQNGNISVDLSYYSGKTDTTISDSYNLTYQNQGTENIFTQDYNDSTYSIDIRQINGELNLRNEISFSITYNKYTKSSKVTYYSYNYNKTIADNKLIAVNFYGYSGYSSTNQNITLNDFSFDANTGKINFKYSINEEDYHPNSPNTYKVSGEVDITLIETI